MATRFTTGSLKSAEHSADRRSWKRNSQKFCASCSRSSSDTLRAESLTWIGFDPVESSNGRNRFRQHVPAPRLLGYRLGRASNRMINHEDNDGAYDSYQEAIEIKSG
jgi:hypothetical protein